MQVKCEYCGAFIKDTDQFCTNCGAVNENLKRSSDGTPKTISELQVWYRQRNLPPMEVTRFFIGEDYKEPRAFGIYESDGEYIVYKNKDDGSRAIRYQGPDEAYAVNEIYLKLKSEILNQKAHNLNKGSAVQEELTGFKKFVSKIESVVTGGIVVIVAIAVVVGLISTAVDWVRNKPYVGKYYSDGNNVYYCEDYVNDEWYCYDTFNRDYYPVYLPEEMYDDLNNYRYAQGEAWDDSIERFEDTETGQYVIEEHSSSSSDSDYDWGSSDSWDSSDSDWGSDW